MAITTAFPSATARRCSIATSWALFVRDSWKLTRKLTLDYGIRWDLAAIQNCTIASTVLAPTTPNPNANGLLEAWHMKDRAKAAAAAVRSLLPLRHRAAVWRSIPAHTQDRTPRRYRSKLRPLSLLADPQPPAHGLQHRYRSVAGKWRGSRLRFPNHWSSIGRLFLAHNTIPANASFRAAASKAPRHWSIETADALPGLSNGTSRFSEVVKDVVVEAYLREKPWRLGG